MSAIDITFYLCGYRITMPLVAAYARQQMLV
jgi:hypothetical protein